MSNTHSPLALAGMDNLQHLFLTICTLRALAADRGFDRHSHCSTGADELQRVLAECMGMSDREVEDMEWREEEDANNARGEVFSQGYASQSSNPYTAGTRDAADWQAGCDALADWTQATAKK